MITSGNRLELGMERKCDQFYADLLEKIVGVWLLPESNTLGGIDRYSNFGLIASLEVKYGQEKCWVRSLGLALPQLQSDESWSSEDLHRMRFTPT